MFAGINNKIQITFSPYYWSRQSGNKKNAWARLTEDFNSIETNVKRTEAQLKKLWDNLKTRRKRTLALEKKERMRTGGGPFVNSKPSTSSELTIDDALVDCVDIEIQGVIDSDVPYDTVEDIMQTEPVVELDINNMPAPDVANTQTSERTRRLGSRFADYGSAQTHAQKNVRATAIAEELKLRLESYTKKQEMEEELHALKIEEAKWFVKAAEEKYKTAIIERQRAEEQLRQTLHKD